MNPGKSGNIKIKAIPGSKILTNADSVTSIDVEQQSTGGVIQTHANHSLTQTGNKMTATDDGTIENTSDDELTQTKNNMEAKQGGHITNAVKVTDEAINTTFINSQITGGVEIAGKNTSFVTTKINEFQRQPLWLKILEVFVGVSAILGVIYTVLQYYK